MKTGASMLGKLRLYLGMIKFSHSIFALPFAFTAMLLAADGQPTLRQVFWITIAMLGARTGAMGFNRVIDRKIDALNPRTAGREIPSGKIRTRDAVLLSVLSFGVLAFAAYMLNPLCFKLVPVAMAATLIYSYTKRFTWLSHVVLGLAISAAPIGAWIAVRGSFSPAIVPLALAVVFWLAGFDILYALSDMEFDREQGLLSIPAKFGPTVALYLACLLHLATWDLLFVTGVLFELGGVYWVGLLIVGGLFIYEHSLVKPNDLSRLNAAFFNMNGYISVTVFVFTFLSYAMRA